MPPQSRYCEHAWSPRVCMLICRVPNYWKNAGRVGNFRYSLASVVAGQPVVCNNLKPEFRILPWALRLTHSRPFRAPASYVVGPWRDELGLLTGLSKAPHNAAGGYPQQFSYNASAVPVLVIDLVHALPAPTNFSKRRAKSRDLRHHMKIRILEIMASGIPLAWALEPECSILMLILYYTILYAMYCILFIIYFVLYIIHNALYNTYHIVYTI